MDTNRSIINIQIFDKNTIKYIKNYKILDNWDIIAIQFYRQL